MSLLSIWAKDYKNLNFRSTSLEINRSLTIISIDFDDPEIYGDFNEDTGVCQFKISEQIVEASIQATRREDDEIQYQPYTKGRHSSELLEMVTMKKVAEKCPIFREMYRSLQRLN
jgi:hypothetical protein